MPCDFFVEHWTFESNDVVTGNQILLLSQVLVLLKKIIVSSLCVDDESLQCKLEVFVGLL